MLLDILNWWQNLPPAEQIFCAIGLISNTLFVIYVVAQLMGSHDADMAADHPDLGILSIRGLLAFAMFLGWTAYLALCSGLSMSLAIGLGILAGALASWLAWRLILLLLRLQVSGTLQPERAIGQTGVVHLRIPSHKKGTGKVMVEVQGALRELEAISEEEAIPTGAPVLIVALTEDGILIAQPYEHHS